MIFVFFQMSNHINSKLGERSKILLKVKLYLFEYKINTTIQNKDLKID
jgi:hypothetical protein